MRSAGPRCSRFSRAIAEVARQPLILVTSLAQAAQFVLHGTLNAFLPLFAREELGLTLAHVGWLFAVQIVTTLARRPIIGAVSDRVGRRGVIAAGLTLCSAAVVLISMAVNASTLVAAVVLYAIGVAVTTAATAAYITDLSHRARYGAAHGVFGTIYDVGDALGPIGGGSRGGSRIRADVPGDGDGRGSDGRHLRTCLTARPRQGMPSCSVTPPRARSAPPDHCRRSPHRPAIGTLPLRPAAPCACEDAPDHQPVDGELAVLQRRVTGEWEDLYVVLPDAAYPADFEVGSWFTSTYPRSPFVLNLTAQRIVGGSRHILRNLTYTVTRAGHCETREVAFSELVPLLRDAFGLDVPEAVDFRASKPT